MNNHGYRANVAPTVCGVRLEPGERVVYFAEPDSSQKKKQLLVLGAIFLLCAGIGLIFFLLYFVYDATISKAQIVTNRRLISISGTNVVTAIPLGDIQDLDAQRQRAGGGGTGALVAGAINIAADLAARKLDRRDPSYWSYAVNVIVVLRSGRKFGFRNSLPQRLGPFLASILAVPQSVEALPEVAYRA